MPENSAHSIAVHSSVPVPASIIFGFMRLILLVAELFELRFVALPNRKTQNCGQIDCSKSAIFAGHPLLGVVIAWGKSLSLRGAEVFRPLLWWWNGLSSGGWEIGEGSDCEERQLHRVVNEGVGSRFAWLCPFRLKLVPSTCESVLRGCRIVANTSVFQTDNAGSIPVIPSKKVAPLSPESGVTLLLRKACQWGG